MLHKSFKAAKCKTSLKLATARIKLLKNKKGVQMNQMKRDLAQLLESGQDRTARIRVEHLIREEKMVAAYDLIELYCELIAARLPIIESQKNCPIDLKEAIASVIFASPRCADVPELLDVKKHLKAKYGKEFVTAALELRPNCGVGRMLIEKLSAIAPDGQAKYTVLNAIAEEHNIKWDSKSFEEKETKPVDELLNGPSTFEKASQMLVETPTSSHDTHTRPMNFTEPKMKLSMDADNVSSTNHGGISTTTTTHPDVRYSENETKEVGQSFVGDYNSSHRQNWNMEFKDARSAAQAAAESAERASIAARAAAEFSRREDNNRQHSSESHNSKNNSTRNERPETSAASELPGEYFGNVPAGYYTGNSNLQNEQTEGNKYQNMVGAAERFQTDGQGNTKISSHSMSQRSGKSTIDNDTSVNSINKSHGYSERSSFEENANESKEPLHSRIDMKKQYLESRAEIESGWQDDSGSEHIDQYGEVSIENQHHLSSSRSHSSTENDDYLISNDNHQKSGNKDNKDIFISVDQDNIYRDATINYYDDQPVTFDENDSDDDTHRIDIGSKYDEGESTTSIPSFGRTSPSFPPTAADIWNPGRDFIREPEKATSQSHIFTEVRSPSLFSEGSSKILEPSESENAVVTAYDDGPKFDSEDEAEISIHGGINDSSSLSHGPKFDSEDEPEISIHGGTNDPSILSQKQHVLSLDPHSTESKNYGSSMNTDYDRRPRVGSSSSDDLDSVEVHLKNNPVSVLTAESSEKFDSGESLANRYSRYGKSQSQSGDIGDESSAYLPVNKENVPQFSSPSLAHGDENNFNATSIPDTDTVKDEEVQNHSNSEEANKLNFGTLTGGFRNKGYKHPPYTKKPSGNASSLTEKATDESSTIIEKMAPLSLKNSSNSTFSNDVDTKSSFSPPNLHSNYDSETDDSGEEVQEKTIRERQAVHAKKSSKEVKNKYSFRPPVATYFDLDNDDYTEDVPEQTVNKGHLGSGISRRTKPSYSSTGTSSYSKTRAGSNASRSSKETEPTGSRPDTGTPVELKSQMDSADYRSQKEQHSSDYYEAPRVSVSEISSNEKILNSSAVKQPSSPPRNTETSTSRQNPKTSVLKVEPPTREDSAKRASHVHPKLPDYDSIAARLQAFRMDKQ